METKKSTPVDLLFGKYRDKLSPSDIFAKSKQLEKEKEAGKWKRQEEGREKIR